jgi:hypothetical protein
MRPHEQTRFPVLPVDSVLPRSKINLSITVLSLIALVALLAVVFVLATFIKFLRSRFSPVSDSLEFNDNQVIQECPMLPEYGV